MNQKHETGLYKSVFSEICKIKIVDCHEHLPSESQFPTGENIHIGRFFQHYARCDLVSAGMPVADMDKVREDSSLSPHKRWDLLKPWYLKAWNTAYCEALRIAMRDIYGVEDFADGTVDALTEAMRRNVKPGFTRRVFDKAGIDFAMDNAAAMVDVPHVDYSSFDPDCFLCDMLDCFTAFDIKGLASAAGLEILRLDDFLRCMDVIFERHAKISGAFKIGRAYDRPLLFEDLPKNAVEKTFNRLLAFNDRPDRRDIQALEDFIVHEICRRCGEYGLRLKFHTGLQEGSENFISNSRAALLANLFMKYPRTKFDIYHISYPYQEEALTLAKNFPNVTVNFCWMWIINPAAGRRALSDMLDAVPLNKIHGFGGDFLFVEGSYAHAAIARREIARVLCEKVEEGRFSEERAVAAGRAILRENAIANFDLERRRAAFRKFCTR